MAPNVYTTVASSMVVHADIVTSRLAPLALGPNKRVLHITPPTGPSSGGGELARQPLTLSSGSEQPVCGWVDFVSATAEVRDFATTKSGYEARYKKPFDVGEEEYRVWLQKLLSVLQELSVRASVTGNEFSYAPTDPAASNPGLGEGPEKEPRSLLPLIIALAVVGLGIGAALMLLLR
jgi:hypothetical protein